VAQQGVLRDRKHRVAELRHEVSITLLAPVKRHTLFAK
jgi:hypothetical protein